MEHEKGNIEAAILGHEQANRPYFELMENFLEAAISVYRVFLAGDLVQKREVVQLVASNAVLHDQKVRLNLKRAPALLAERPKQASGARRRTMFELFQQLRDALREEYYQTRTA